MWMHAPILSLFFTMNEKVGQKPDAPTNCPLCGSSAILPWFVSDDRRWRTYGCQQCDLWFVWPPESGDLGVDPAGLDYFDSDAYLQTARIAYAANTNAHIKRFQYIVRRALKSLHIDPTSPELVQIKAADLGCGVGTSVAAMAQIDIEAVGCDYSSKLIEYAESLYPDMDLRCGSLEVLENGAYDLISAYNLIEHVKDLHGFVAGLREKLKPGGLLVLETPNRYSLFQSVLAAVRRAGICAHTLSQDGGHIYLFTHQALYYLLSKHGFSEVDYFKLMSPWRELSYKTQQRKGLLAATMLSSVYLLSVLTGRKNRMVMVARKDEVDKA